MTTTWNISRDENGKQSVAAFVNGSLRIAEDNHPNYDTICQKLISGDYDNIELSYLFDIPLSIGQKFDRLTRRISVSNNALYFDGEPLHSTLVDTIVRAYNEGASASDTWAPLVAFLDKVQDNPNAHSRENLFRWLDNLDFGITDDGNFLAYKGVNAEWLSSYTGQAIVNGVVVNGNIPYEIGSVVEMPRGEVEWDPSAACSTGIHAGTYDYAKGYSRGGHMLLVSIDPADVVSVPTDCNGQKLRCCRVTVVGEADAALGTLIQPTDEAESNIDDVTDLGEITAPTICPECSAIPNEQGVVVHHGPGCSLDPASFVVIDEADVKLSKRDRDDKIRDAKAFGMSDRKICKEFKVGRRKLHKILKGA